ncbi:MAG: tetratricopeptide repeat protein [Saprospiraceae bacterium]
MDSFLVNVLAAFYRPVLIGAFSLCCVHRPFAQTAVLDSLKTELAKAKEDTTRILLKKDIAASLYKINKDSALHLVQSTIPLAEKINYKTGLFELWFIKAYIHMAFNQLDSAFMEYDTAKEIASAAGDKERQVRALNALSYCVHDKRLGIPYLNEALEIASNTRNRKKQADVLISLGILYSNLASYDTAEINYERAFTIQRELGDKKAQANTLINLGNNAGRSNNIKKALDYYERGVLLMRELGDKSGEAALYNMKGYACSVMGNFPKALEYGQTALKLMEEDGNKAGMADCCNRLCEFYLSMEDYSQALYYIEKSFKLWEEMGGGVQQSDLLFQKGDIYLLKKDYENALLYLSKSLNLKKTIGQTVGYKHYYDLGNCYEQLNRPDSALVFFQLALQASSESDNSQMNKSNSLKSLGNIHFQQGKTSQAVAELNEAMETATISGNREQEMESAEVLYRIYKSQNNVGKALYYHETYRSLQDSLFNEKNAKQIGRLEANYEFEKEKQELAYEQEKELERQGSMRRLMLIALCVAVLFIGIIYRYYRSKQKANALLTKLNEEISGQKAMVELQKEKLVELDLAKSRFFTNISHEFRTPLTIISGMIDQVYEKPDLWLERGHKMIKQNTAGLLNLVNQILDLRKLESKELKVQMVQGDIVKYLRYVTESHQSYANSKGLQLHFLAAQPEINMDYDPDKILRITSNLLSNAIKFTKEGGHVYFHIDKKNKGGEPVLSIRVEDTGVGIPEKELPHIFSRFYQVDGSSTRRGEGTGIGLALTKELVKLMGGEIRVRSTVGKGSTFSVDLPITEASETAVADGFDSFEAHQSTESVVAEPVFAGPSMEMQAATEEDAMLGTDGKPRLLIVEDNPDVQQYLVACLEDDYQLTVADNGQTGIDMAIEQVPDLVVSDVMMPEKDGYELTEALKNDERTDHIPIILLTAKADMDSKISGLQKGADAYLLKPFEKRELLVRLEKLLELRKKLQARFALLPAEVSGPAAIEDPFLQKFYSLVEAEIANPELDMNKLCRSLGMSRSQVFRKLKALTGKSATLFIRSIRLQKGKELLGQGELTISEVAYEVGFTSLSYFSRAFLEEFGVAPSATRK